MAHETMIDIAQDFSSTPAGRFYDDGPYSGQLFRERYLKPRLQESFVTVVLDGAFGLPVSFLEEAFGGLVREGFSASELRKKLRFIANTDRMRRYPPPRSYLVLYFGCR